MTLEERNSALTELLNYEWDIVGYQIMHTYCKNKASMFMALSSRKHKLETEKQAKLQTKVLETAKKQNLSALKYGDHALTRRKLC